jgi:hypothetical protein
MLRWQLFDCINLPKVSRLWKIRSCPINACNLEIRTVKLHCLLSKVLISVDFLHSRSDR